MARFLRVCAALAAIAVLIPLLVGGYSTDARVAMAGCLALTAVALGVASLPRRHEQAQGLGLLAALSCAVLLFTAIGWFSRLGVHFVGLQTIAVVVLAAGVLLHPLYAWLLAGAGWLAIGVLAFAVPGLPDAVVFPEQVSVANRVIVHSFGVALALAMAHVLHAILSENERRTSGLLRIAVKVYWEMDAQHRLKHLSAGEHMSLAPAARWHGRPWNELEDLQVDEATACVLQRRLESLQPFEDLSMRLRDGSGRLHEFMWSGEPRFDAWGVFLGFWGVARDVSEQLLIQREVAASEVRYRELFTHCPLPLVLHRAGTVVDTNPAAVALFGHVDRNSMIGRDMFDQLVDEGDAMRRALARTAEAMAGGAALPPAQFWIRDAAGERRSVQATATRVDMGDGPAMLSFFVDDTEQRAAELKLAQSRRLLELLIDACPDTIALSDMETGRYVLVNQAFVRMTGISAEEAIGRSGTELQLWVQPDQRRRMLEQVRATGRIDQFRTLSRHREGRFFTLTLSGASFRDGGREYLLAVGRDTTDTDRTRMEHEAILQRASIGIAYTRDRRFFHANAQFERMFGWGPGELLEQAGSVIWPSAEAYAEAGRIFGPALSAGRGIEVERELRRRDGSTFWCRMLAQVLDAGDTTAGTIWIAEDVTERRRVEQALAAARDAAESASRAKSAFLANMSHEIRTPLNGLMGLARLAQDNDLPAPRQQEYLRQILESAQSLSDVLSDILDLSKVEAGKLSIENVTFDLGGMLRAVHRAYLPLAQARGLRLELDVHAQLADWVHGDLVRVRQIVTNFVTNALKFTHEGHVHIRARPCRDGVHIEVQDSGLGIDAETQARLFRPFTQADESTTRRFGGTGLGLSICRELAMLMGGRVGVMSQPGQGSCFWMELPLPRAEAPPAPQDEGPVDEQPLAGAHILVAEDNPVNMLIAVAMLEQWGADVAQAADGRVALARVEAARRDGRPFDVVLMDVQMPEMGGYEATRALRQHYSARDLPVLGLTAAALVEERHAGIDSGMNDFLTKPIEPRRLLEALRRWCTVRA